MSLVGGGSRLSYYFKKKGSAVLSTSIDKYVYITVNKKFDSNISLSYLITENVLDMMHISYVHSFGNSLAPVPFKIDYDDINELSGRTTFHYTAGRTSMSRLIGGAKYVKVENEFHLPDVTVTRVKANNIVKTIITHCYPIGKNESMLHFDLYRNFLTSSLFDPLFEYQMKITLDEDVDILNWLYDDHILGFMSNKYDITQIKYREKTKKLLKKFEYDNKNNTKIS